MLIDSHCHPHLMDLTPFNGDIDNLLGLAATYDVCRLLCVAVDLSDYPTLCALADKYRCILISIGVHPNHETDIPVTCEQLSQLALQHKACVAIGETGLDYYRLENEQGQALQQQQFREHIRAAIQTSKPLIIHTRQAAQDTLRLMREENAQSVGGVMHCFSETKAVAKEALDLNFYISLSGILTFKNAETLREVASYVPLDRLLIETDSPYLAPVPFRGKPNHPGLVKYVAMALADIRGVSYEVIAKQTTENFERLFGVIQS